MAYQQNCLNNPNTTRARLLSLRNKSYLRNLYCFWYSEIKNNLPEKQNCILELGSGGGFLKEHIPRLITSDVQLISELDFQIDAREIPFQVGYLCSIVGTNVLHHIPEIWKFFQEADRVLTHGGRLVFIEPWPTFFSWPIYKFLHHEPFDMKSDWSIPFGGPLTAANGALPWIIFSRDRQKFENDYPRLRIIKIEPFMPLSYLVSGGIEQRWPLPAWFFSIVRFLEKPLDFLGLFALIVVEKTQN